MMILLVAEYNLSPAEGQTVGKQLSDALQAGEGVVRQIWEGGAAVINNIGSFFGARDVENDVDKAKEALAEGDNENATATIANIDADLQNSSARISGLAQYIDNIAKNQSLSIDQSTRQTLTNIGNALISFANDTDGVFQSNSSSS